MKRDFSRDGVVVIVGPEGSAATWRTCCARLDIAVVEVADAAAAVALLPQAVPIAVVADAEVGDAALRDLCAHVRQVPELRLIPILLTGPDNAQCKRLPLRTGADGYVPECGGTLALQAHIWRWLTVALGLHKAVAPHATIASLRPADRRPAANSAGQHE